MENIRLLDATLALRLGKPLNLDLDLSGYTAASNIRRAEFNRLRALRQSNDLAKLKAALDELSADELVSPELLPETLPSLEAAGLQDEAKLLFRDSLSRKLYRDVLACWLVLMGETCKR